MAKTTNMINKKRSKMKKTKNRKQADTNSPSPSAAAGQDILGLLTTLVQKLTSFETKIDMVLSRIPAQPSVAPRPQQPAPVPSNERPRDPRPMHDVICSDCGKDCKVPFKPSGDRPVYCKECFRARKNKSSIVPQADSKPKEGPPVDVRPPDKPKATKPAKPAKKKTKKKAAPARKKKRA